MRKTTKLWDTEKCCLCGEPHTGYSGKLDSEGVEYVMCGLTNKPTRNLEGWTSRERKVFVKSIVAPTMLFRYSYGKMDR